MKKNPKSSHTQRPDVAGYYDANTKRFLKSGTGAQEMAIHRPVWGEGVSSRAGAIHYVDALLLEELETAGIRSVIDLGCGVGGTMAYLAPRHRARYTGITISKTQTQLGAELISNTPSLNDADIVLGDMTDGELIKAIRSASPSPTMFYCVESFLHVDNGADFLATIAKVMRNGDMFAICDDFLATSSPPFAGRSIVEDFSAGWRAPSCTAVEVFLQHCRQAGLELRSQIDLTQYLKLWRPSNIGILLLVNLLKPFHPKGAWWDNFIGGNALQKGYSRELFTYQFMVLKKPD